MNGQKLSKVFYIIPAIVCFLINANILLFAWNFSSGETIAHLSIYEPIFALLSFPFVCIIGVLFSFASFVIDDMLKTKIQNPYFRIMIISILMFSTAHLLIFFIGWYLFRSNYELSYSFAVCVKNIGISIVLYSIITSFLFYFCSDNCQKNNINEIHKKLETKNEDAEEIIREIPKEHYQRELLPFDKYFMIFFPVFLLSSIVLSLYSIISLHLHANFKYDITQGYLYLNEFFIVIGMIISVIFSSLISAIVLKFIHKKAYKSIISNILMFISYTIIVLTTFTYNVIFAIMITLLYLYPLYKIKSMKLFENSKDISSN